MSKPRIVYLLLGLVSLGLLLAARAVLPGACLPLGMTAICSFALTVLDEGNL